MAACSARTIGAAIVVMTMLSMLTTTSGCLGFGDDPKPVSLSDTEPVRTATATTPGSTVPSLDIAVAAMISPKETMVSYRDMLDYIADKTGAKGYLLGDQQPCAAG